METAGAKCSAVLSGRDDLIDALPATMWLANFRLSRRDEAERRSQTKAGGNGVARVATKISLLTELSDGARLCR